MTRVPFRRLFIAARVSRGVSAIGATISFRLGPARTKGLATHPSSKIEVRSVGLLLPTTLERIPVPCLFPAHRHRLFVGRVLGGMPPVETGDESASRRPHRFGGPRWLRGGVFFRNPRALRSSL